MKPMSRSLIAASLMLSLSGLSLAQTAPEHQGHAPRADRMEKMHAKMGERHAKHLAELKGKLKPDKLSIKLAAIKERDIGFIKFILSVLG